MSRAQRRARRRLKVGPIRSPLEPVPPIRWPDVPDGWVRPLAVWESAALFVVLYGTTPLRRLSIQRRDGRDGLLWDDLHWVKEQLLPGLWAVEAYPPDAELLNVANIRHLYVYPQGHAPPFNLKAGD